MYFIIRDKKPNLEGLTPQERRAATDAWDKAQGMTLQQAAAERRKVHKRMRFEDLAERPDLLRKSYNEAKAIRKNMERRINEL